MDGSRPYCADCGHHHTGPNLGYICIGCPCENYIANLGGDTTTDELGRLVVEQADDA